MKVEEPDRALWRLVTTFPRIPLPIKYLLLVINMFFPGIGTILYALGGYRPISKTQLVIGVMQYATKWMILGYAWSVIWGILFFYERKTRPEEEPIINPADVQVISSEMLHMPEGTIPKVVLSHPAKVEPLPEENKFQGLL